MSDHQSTTEFVHTKTDNRIPRLYKEVGKVLQDVKACKGNIKTVMYNSRLRGSAWKKAYVISVNVLKYRSLFEKLIERIAVLEEVHQRREIVEIMLYEIIFGKGLFGESKPVLAMKELQDEILRVYDTLKDECSSLTDLYLLPKYVRVNSLKTTTFTVLKDLENHDYKQIVYDDNVTFDEFLSLVKCLNLGSFLIDYHFKDLFVFSSKENLSNWPLFQKGHVFIQDKSSYIPVHVLDPKPNSAVIDACAAPGMKTIHIAALMQSTGKIFAFEKDQKRFETLQNMTRTADITICKSRCEDFYLVNKDDPKYSSVECILVDPSCSGTGMVNRMDKVTDNEYSKNKMRFQKLAGFQILLLKHALSFPSVKRVVYSTCSITEEENEFVVHEVLNSFSHSFKLGHVMPHWPIRGFESYEYGPLCLRTFSEKTLTNGFFVAMFERLNHEEQQERYEKSLDMGERFEKAKSKKRKSLAASISEIDSGSMKKKQKLEHQDEVNIKNGNFIQLNTVNQNNYDNISDSKPLTKEDIVEISQDNEENARRKHKKRKKCKDKESEVNESNSEFSSNSNSIQKLNPEQEDGLYTGDQTTIQINEKNNKKDKTTLLNSIPFIDEGNEEISVIIEKSRKKHKKKNKCKDLESEVNESNSEFASNSNSIQKLNPDQEDGLYTGDQTTIQINEKNNKKDKTTLLNSVPCIDEGNEEISVSIEKSRKKHKQKNKCTDLESEVNESNSEFASNSNSIQKLNPDQEDGLFTGDQTTIQINEKNNKKDKITLLNSVPCIDEGNEEISVSIEKSRKKHKKKNKCKDLESEVNESNSEFTSDSISIQKLNPEHEARLSMKDHSGKQINEKNNRRDKITLFNSEPCINESCEEISKRSIEKSKKKHKKKNKDKTSSE